MELARTMDSLVRSFDDQHRFTASDLCEIHKSWLGSVYKWASAYRGVNISKGNFPFAMAAHVPRLMREYEQGPLHRYTPCRFERREEIVRGLAETHVELVLIHPFREGNGRLARILSTLMALQAGLPLLDFSVIAEEKKEEYFAAVRAAA